MKLKVPPPIRWGKTEKLQSITRVVRGVFDPSPYLEIAREMTDTNFDKEYTPDPRGLVGKYIVYKRNDDGSQGDLVEGPTFILRPSDPHAQTALLAYAASVRDSNSELADDLETLVRQQRQREEDRKKWVLFFVRKNSTSIRLQENNPNATSSYVYDSGFWRLVQSACKDIPPHAMLVDGKITAKEAVRLLESRGVKADPLLDKSDDGLREYDTVPWNVWRYGDGWMRAQPIHNPAFSLMLLHHAKIWMVADVDKNVPEDAAVFIGMPTVEQAKRIVDSTEKYTVVAQKMGETIKTHAKQNGQRNTIQDHRRTPNLQSAL